MAFKPHRHWVELIAVLFLIVGFFFAILLRYSLLSYLTLLLSGGLAGRVLYIKHAHEPILPVVLIIVGFLFGYLLGGIHMSWLISITLFLLGGVASYYLHVKKIFTTFKSDLFIK